MLTNAPFCGKRAKLRPVLRLLFAIGVILSIAVSAASQAASPVPLSPALLDVIKRGRFAIVTSIGGLPLGVRNELRTLFGSQTLDIAQPGAEFQATDVIVKPNLPHRRLSVAGCTAEYCLVYYERGGFVHTWHVAVFHWTPDATRFEWGGAAPGGLATIADVRKAILSGDIRGPAAFW